ncbi:MAG: Inner rane amino-acid transporter permease protein YhdY [Deinococcota bacterium]|jgi:general L-amino acid transport system permease protein
MQATNSNPPSRDSKWQLWAKENLFSNTINSILTILTGVLVIWVVSSLGIWALTQAKWNVIPANFRILMTGSFPTEQLWRTWTALIVVCVASGLHWGSLSRGAKLPIWTYFFGAAITLFTAITQVGHPSGILVPAAVLAVFAGYFIGQTAIPSRIMNIAWVVIFFATVLLFTMDFGTGAVQTKEWGGLLLTLMLSIVGIVASFPLGVALAIGRTSNYPIISAICTVFIEVVRGTPLVVVFFIAQLFVPLLLGGVNIDPVARAMVGITIFSAAYLAENVRGGLQSVPQGQIEAARAVGLNGTQTLLLIVLPQALKAVLPALVGQFIGLFKDTSLVYIIGLKELAGISDSIRSNPDFIGTAKELYFTISIIYFIFSYAMSSGARSLEKQLNTNR